MSPSIRKRTLPLPRHLIAEMSRPRTAPSRSKGHVKAWHYWITRLAPEAALRRSYERKKASEPLRVSLGARLEISRDV